MGWLELQGWLNTMTRQRQGAESDSPDSWDGADRSSNWQELHRERDRMLGR